MDSGRAPTAHAGPRRYRILVGGQVDPARSADLGCLRVRWDGYGNTVLTGVLPDQAALHGVLGRLRDLSLPLLALRQVAASLDTRPRSPSSVQLSPPGGLHG